MLWGFTGGVTRVWDKVAFLLPLYRSPRALQGVYGVGTGYRGKGGIQSPGQVGYPPYRSTYPTIYSPMPTPGNPIPDIPYGTRAQEGVLPGGIPVYWWDVDIYSWDSTVR